ncbi:MAG: hypothetical protein PVJ41_15325 [Desulfobacterales bacterium]|jgi:hypothetical protein
MIRSLIVILAAAFLSFSCATDPGPKPIFQDDTRVGILNSLEPYLTHRHITIDRINSFTKQIKVDWVLPAYVDTQLMDSLKKDKRFVVVPIRSPQILERQKQLADQINAAATRRRVSQGLVDLIEDLAKTHDLDVIIMVQSFRGESPWRIHDDIIMLEGYGLFTRRTLLGSVGVRNSWVHPYAQIRLVVFQTQPIIRIGTGLPRLTRARMDNFNWPADINNIPQTELDKIRPRIQAYADQAVNNALQDAHMIMVPSE